MIKVIIAGTRDFEDYDLVKRKCLYYLKNMANVTIISGCAKGADKLGERLALEMGFNLFKFPADWSLGLAAGPIRNLQMAKEASHLIAFWDGKSKGTLNMIQTAKKQGLKTRVVKI